VEPAAASQYTQHSFLPLHTSLDPGVVVCPCSYNNPEALADDCAKDPPIMPPHLQLTLLNVPPAMDHQAALPRPQHVILNHLYSQRGQVRDQQPSDNCSERLLAV
jgi:5'-AMP-activated protein kinase, regulatory beta subunit